MISLWKLREKKNVAQMPFVKNTPESSAGDICKSASKQYLPKKNTDFPP